MRLITYRDRAGEQSARLAAIVGDLAIDLGRLAQAADSYLPDTMLGLIEAGPSALALANRLLKEYDGRWPVGSSAYLTNVKILAPIPRPRKNIFGIGLNYLEHVDESSRSLDTSKDLPTKPVVFSKPPTSVIGPGDAIEHNALITQQLDWEVELAVIIGKSAKRVDETGALSHVFGYTVINDISARDNRRAGQWIFSKGQDSYAPMGPCVVTADEIPDPHHLNLSLRKNGEVMQSSNTRHMLFKIPALVADISAAMTLEPGDIIATGTPAGVGAGRSPQEWMWPGDVLEAEVEGIGVLRNPVIAV